MLLIKKDTFVKDIIVLLLVGIIIAALFAAGFALTTDKYFAKAVVGIMGDFGEYDLLFQGRQELKGALIRQIREVVAEYFPGATIKSGISLAGQTTVFLTLPDKYKTKAIFNNLGHYFSNLPGNAGFSIMTEPMISVSSVPKGAFDLLSNEIEGISGVKFAFKDGNSIGVVLKDIRFSDRVDAQIKQILNKYQVLELRMNSGFSSEEMIDLGRRVSQSLIGKFGINYARDITLSGGADEYQYMVNTLSEIKKFLLAYAAEVKIIPEASSNIEIGDLLVLNGQNVKKLKPGDILEPLHVVVKTMTIDASGVHGLIIQGDAEYLDDHSAYQLLPGDKIGQRIGQIEVSSRKAQLVYAMNQGVKLLTSLNQAIADYNQATGGPGLTVNNLENVYQQLLDVKQALNTVETGVDSLSGRINRTSLVNMANLINGIGDDLDYLAKTFGRVQILESRFNQTLEGLDTARLIMGSPLLQEAIDGKGGIFEKIQLLNEQLTMVESSLRERVQSLDDFINRFNPLVAVLLSWRNKARDLAEQANSFGAVFTPGSENHQKLVEMIEATDQVISGITGFDLENTKIGLDVVSKQLFGSGNIDLSVLIAELERVKNSLPQLLDEEIGNAVNLINKYVDGESISRDRIQIFTQAVAEPKVVEATVKRVVGFDEVAIFSLPVGTIQPNIRGELFKILAEVRSTIAALVVTVLWLLGFILDHSLIISMLKKMEFSLLPKINDLKCEWLQRFYNTTTWVLSWSNIYAALVGGFWLAVTYYLAGASIPLLDYWHIGILGGILGIGMAMIAEKINPINKEEVMAGLSLGLSFKTIMQEIVIPAGRPGLLQFLNRWKMTMK